MVALSGYYGFGNLGDEAVLSGAARGLRQVLGNQCRLLAFSADPEATRAMHGLDACARGLVSVWRAMGRADVLVSGGGSLLQDATSARSLLYYLAVMAVARARGAGVVWLAQGIGPVRRRWLRWLVGRFARWADAVTVRDEASRTALVAMGADRERIRVTADAAWLLAGATREREKPGAAGEQGPRRQGMRLAVAWREWRGQAVSSEEAGRALGRALAVAVRGPCHVRVVALQPGRDVGACHVVAAGVTRGWRAEARGGRDETDPEGGLEATAEVAPADPERAVRWLAQFDAVIGVRLHALVLAALAGVPFVAVGYDPKVEGFLGQVRWPIPAMAPSETGDVRSWVARLRSLLENRGLLALHLERCRHGQVERAMGSVEAVRGVLERRGVRRLTPAVPLAAGAATGARPRILGVPVDPIGVEEATDRIGEWMASVRGSGRRVRHVVTLNPEMVMRARDDVAFWDVLASADLVVPDGIGVVWGLRMLGVPVAGRVPGVDLAQSCLARAARMGAPVMLVGGTPGEVGGWPVAELAAYRLMQVVPGLRVAATHHGYFAWGGEEEEALLAGIEQARPALLLVGMGSPRQELWIARHRERLAGAVGVAMGVGGSLDVWAGRTRRAPAFARRAGVEWLWRLLQEPRRAGRMRVLPVFAAHVLACRARKSA